MPISPSPILGIGLHSAFDFPLRDSLLVKSCCANAWYLNQVALWRYKRLGEVDAIERSPHAFKLLLSSNFFKVSRPRIERLTKHALECVAWYSNFRTVARKLVLELQLVVKDAVFRIKLEFAYRPVPYAGE